MRYLLAARLSQLQKSKNGERQEGIGLETQDTRAREWAERMGHVIVATVADTKSGTVAPWDRKNLKPWVTDPALIMQYDGILAFKTDRLSRGTQEDFTTIEMWATTNGKSLVIADGPQYPARDDSDYWQWTAEKRQARKEWEAGRERSMRAQTELLRREKLVGRPPWGYTSVGEKYDHTIVPTPEGRRYIPEIFSRVVAGQPLATIVAWLAAEGMKPTSGPHWTPKTLSMLVRNATYTGRRMNAAGEVILRCDPLVSVATFNAADSALKERFRRRGVTTKRETALLTGVLFCQKCGGQMYRVNAGRTGTAGAAGSYRCTVSPQYAGERRSTCANMISVTLADAYARDKLVTLTDPVLVPRWVDGDDTAAQLAETAADLAALEAKWHSRSIGRAEYFTALTELDTAREELEKKEPVPGRYVMTPTGETMGEVAARLDDDDLRKVLTGSVRIYADVATFPRGAAFNVALPGTVAA